MIVYSLREDPQQVADTQAASLSPKPFGLKPTHGLFGSEEWWRNVETGVIPMVRLRGRITRLVRAGMHNDTPCFEMVLPDGQTFEWNCEALHRRDRRHYRVGAVVEFDYVMQELKQPVETPRGPKTHVRCPVEIRIEPS